jgi:hypothetical protein
MGATVTAAPMEEEAPHQIRWRKGEMIGLGAFGQVFMGMNLDSGELLAVKEVRILIWDLDGILGLKGVDLLSPLILTLDLTSVFRF